MTLVDFPTVVIADRQRRYHDAAQVPMGLFGGQVDLSILANDTIHATTYLKTEDVDGLHAGQRMTQRRPVRLGEELTLKGRVSEIKPAKRGAFVTFAFDFVTADGDVPVTGTLVSFRVDAAAMRQQDGTPPADQPDLAGFRRMGAKHTTPERVKAYSFEFPDYLVHFDPKAAADVGLPAPVAQGLMSFTWMTELVAAQRNPDVIDISATFRQPIYWDNRPEIYMRGDRDILVVKPGAGVCSTGTVLSAGG